MAHSEFHDIPYFSTKFFCTPFFKQPFFEHNAFFQGMGSACGGGVHVPVADGTPSVVRSHIEEASFNDIQIVFDEELEASPITGDLTLAFSAIVDGGTPLEPLFVVVHGKGVILSFPSSFGAGQVVTWAYDDTTGTTIKAKKAPYDSIDNQTYAVQNNATSADAPMIQADEVNINANEEEAACDAKPKKRKAKK